MQVQASVQSGMELVSSLEPVDFADGRISSLELGEVKACKGAGGLQEWKPAEAWR
jgi:hypothetical protein